MLQAMRSPTGRVSYDLAVLTSQCGNGETVEARLVLVPRDTDTPTPITVASAFVNGRDVDEAQMMGSLLARVVAHDAESI
jgi:hypothetical protein